MSMPELAPEQQLTPFQMISEGAVRALEGALRSALKEDAIGDREDVRAAWKLRNYCRGKQHAVWDARSYIYTTIAASGEEEPAHMGVYNITKPHKRSFVAILSENSPGVNFTPDSLGSPNDETAAKNAEKWRGDFDRMVDMRKKQSKFAGYECTDGRIVTRTWINEQGKICVDLNGVLESKILPRTASDVEEFDACILSHEVSKWRAKSQNPDFKDKISAGDSGGDNEYKRYARLGVISKHRGGQAEVLKNLVTEHWCWLDPCRYLKMNDEVQEEIAAAFPSGVRIHAYGDVVVDAVEETMIACLSVDYSEDGDGNAIPALLSDIPDIQDAYNDLKNILRELAEYGIPATWVNTDGGVDLEAIAEQRSTPGAVHGIAAGSREMSELILQEQAISISQELLTMLAALKQDAEYTSGDFPQLQGDEVQGQDTVGVNKLLTERAKGQLGPPWAAIQRWAAKVYTVGIPLAAQLAQQPITIKGPNGQDIVDPHAILDGKFGCSPDKDSSFPQTTADKRAALATLTADLVAAGEAGIAILGQPDNLKLRLQLSGLSGLFVIPDAQSGDKQLREIEQMLEQFPVPPSQQAMQQWAMATQQAQASGQPPPPKPPFTSSVSVDQRWDRHQAHIDKVQEWLESDACAEALRNGKMDGVENIRLHGVEHDAALASQQQAAAPAPPPPRVTLTVPISDPAAIAQFSAQAGATTSTPQGAAASVQPEVDKTVAQTQHAAAQAQHVSVLAARERVAPHDIPQPPIAKQAPPDDSGGSQ